jgi:Family of unknown function (DUF5681)
MYLLTIADFDERSCRRRDSVHGGRLVAISGEGGFICSPTACTYDCMSSNILAASTTSFNAFVEAHLPPGAVRSDSMKKADDISGSKQGKRCRSKTDNTNAQQKPWLFKPGQSGNPAGRPKGSRNKLAEDFLRGVVGTK